MASSDETVNVTRKAAFGTLATLVLRLVSFACTQWTFRVLDPATLGRTSIQLELLHSSVIFLSREGFRLALTRQLTDDDDKSIDNWNVAWLTIPVATLVSTIALGWHLLVVASSANDPDYRRAGILYCLACCLEGWAEPAALLALRQMNVAIKASAEGLATVGKTVATFIFLQYLQDTWPITAFGLAQVVYSVIYAFILYRSVWNSLLGPRWGLWDGRTCYMTVIFTVQGFFKHLLTEGDRIVLSTLAQSYDQGVYAMASAYGGLAARIILQPIEENGRLLWSRQSSRQSSQAPPKRRPGETNNLDDPLLQSYIVLVKLVLYIGFIFSFLAINYTTILLNLLAGKKWGENPQAAAVLSAFCVYTAFLAWNGTTEAFVYGVASSGADIGRLGAAHTVVGLIFATIAPIAVSRYGTVGLVAANCLAMFCRSMYSVHYAATYFARRFEQSTTSTWYFLVRCMFPHGFVLTSFVASYLVTRSSLTRFVQKVADEQIETASTVWLRLVLEHIAIGASMGIGLLSLAYFVEGDYRSLVRRVWYGKTD